MLKSKKFSLPVLLLGVVLLLIPACGGGGGVEDGTGRGLKMVAFSHSVHVEAAKILVDFLHDQCDLADHQVDI